VFGNVRIGHERVHSTFQCPIFIRSTLDLNEIRLKLTYSDCQRLQPVVVR
jgi:hypothetical protein